MQLSGLLTFPLSGFRPGMSSSPSSVVGGAAVIEMAGCGLGADFVGLFGSWNESPCCCRGGITAPSRWTATETIRDCRGNVLSGSDCEKRDGAITLPTFSASIPVVERAAIAAESIPSTILRHSRFSSPSNTAFRPETSAAPTSWPIGSTAEESCPNDSSEMTGILKSRRYRFSAEQSSRLVTFP